MAAGGTLTLTPGADYVFSATEVWSGIKGNGSTQGARLNTQGQTLSVSNLDHLIGGTSAQRKDVVTLAGAGGNTITVQALETLIGSSGNDRVLLTTTGTTMVVESIETIIGATTGTSLITLAGTTGNTMSVGYLKTIVGSVGEDVIRINAAGSIGSTMAVSLMETLIGTDGLDLIATVGGGSNTMLVQGIEIILGNGSAAAGNDTVFLASGGNTIGIAFLETLIGGSGNDVATLAFKSGTANLQTGGGTLAISSIETIVGGATVSGNGGRSTAILLDVGNTITVASLSTLIGGGGKDVVNITLRDGTAIIGDGPIPWSTSGSTMLVSLIETMIGSSGDDVVVALNNTGMTLAVSAIESVIGKAGNDAVYLGAGGNTIQVEALETLVGGSGNDVVTARTILGTTMMVSAVETLVGQPGTDVVYLGAGGNTVQVGALETVIGGTGNDVVTVTDTAGTIFVSGVETVYTPYQTLTLNGVDTYISLPPVAADTTPPSITAVSIPNTAMKIGDVVTATITVASDSDTYTLGAGSTIGGFTLGNLTKVNATTYTATFTVTSGGTDVAAGSDVPVSLVLTDGAGNSNTAYATAISQGADRIDANRPTIASATVNGTSLTVTFAEAVSAASAAGLTVTVAGQSRVATYASGSGGTTLTFTLASAVTQGQTVTLDYDPGTGNLTDTASNAPASVTGQAVTNTSPPAADTTPPSITAVSIPNTAVKIGDTVTATITVASDSDTYTLGAGSTIGGFTLGNLTKVNATTYTATFTVTADGQRTGDRAANQDVPVNIVLVDSASNANTAYTTPISQNNDRIDTNAPPVLAVPTTPPTLVDTTANDTFPLVSGQLSATDLEGDTLIYSIAGSQASPVQHGSVTLSNGVTYDAWSTGPGGTSYINSQTGEYAYVFDAAFLNGVPAGPMQGTSSFTVSDGNRTVEQQLTLNFTGANDSPILSNDVRSLTAIDQGIADASNTGMTVTALLASAGTVTDAEYDSPVPMVIIVPLGVAITGVTNTNGVWQYKVGSGNWTDIPAGSSNGSALLLAGSDRVRFVPSGSGFTNTDTGGLTFKAWDRTSGTAGSTADTTTGSAYSVASATATITVDAVPTLTATGGNKVFGVGASSPTSLFSGVAASTVEAGQSFRGAVFTVSGVTDATEVLSVGGTDVALTNGATATLIGLGAAGGNASVAVSVVAGVATVTVTGLERTDAQMSTLLGGLAYKNTSGAATLGNRTVAIASLTDSGGATGNASITGVSAVVNVADVTPPAVPVITSAALTNSATPTLAGTAEAGSTVTVTVGGATYTTTATGGNWSLNLATATPVTGTLSLNANGANSVSVTATDASSNTSDPGTQTLTIDTTLPSAPAVTSAALTNSATPIITGTAEAGTTVTVTVGGATYITTATGGAWSLNLATATPVTGTLSLNANGANPVSATATDAAGNVSVPGTQSLVIDTASPNAPVITSAALTNSATPIITGTAEAGTTVTIMVGGATYTTTATGGAWSLNLATATPVTGTLSLNANGANSISVTATDAAGNVSAPGSQSLVIDTASPNAPVITTALTNSATPTITGTAEAGATVTVSVGGATYSTTATGGAWSLNLATATPISGSLSLNANGANPVSATATDAAGNVSAPGSQSLVIDTASPNAPVITTALTNSAAPVIGGTAEAGSTVTVTVGGATYTTTATGGTWSLNLATATPVTGTLSLNTNGANPVSATATDAAGNVSAPGSQSLVIDTTLPNAPAVTSAALTNSTTPIITGTAEAGTTVTVTVGGATYTTTATGGNWSLNLATATPVTGTLSLNANGTNPVSVTATDAAGNVSAPGSQSLVIDTTNPSTPTVTTALTNSTTPTITGTAEAGTTVTVTVGGATYTTTTTGGAWSLNLATATPVTGTLSLNANGANPVSATATDAAGNVSAPGGQSLVIDTTLPNTPAVTSAALTNSATPIITGTAEAGSTVTVTVGGATYTTTATGGAWSLDLSTATPISGLLSLNVNGTNPVSATATDAAGNVSAPGSQSLVIDTTLPNAPAVTSAALTNSATPTLAGTAEAGNTVTVTVGGATYTTTATGGNWSLNLATATPVTGTLNLNANGANPVSVTATDAAGNVSVPGSQSLVIDTTNPSVPTVTTALTNSTTPIITGTAEAGTTVTVTVGGATYTTTATGGNWSIDLSTATPVTGTLSLNANGANPVSATATDAAGNVSAPGSQSLVIDTTLPNAPAVISAALTNSATPTITGTAEAGTTVTVTVGGATYTTTATGGNWSIDLSTATPVTGTLSLNANGANPISATATDASGNVSAPGGQSLVVDTTAPTATVLFEDDSIDAVEQSNSAFTISGSEAGATFTWTITSSGGGRVTGSGVMTAGTTRVTGLDLSGLGDGTLTLSLGLIDPAGNASAPFAATTQKLTATVDKPTQVAPPPAATVDGATVNGSVATAGDGTRTATVTIAATNSNRQEDGSTANADLADVPVVREQVVDRQTGQVSTVTTLTVSVSTGVAVTTTGSAERQTAGQALTGVTGLIAAIEARTDEGTAARTGLTGGGAGFLSALSSQAELLVRTIDFSAPGVATGQAVQTKVTGNTLGGTGIGSTAPTAVVLNTTSVSAPVTIQLDNVEFAAVIGNATLVGGDGEQVVYGDANQQWLYLGAGDDELHGGGGNDTVASAGGNDTLFGDDGDDVVMGGEGDDWVLGGDGTDLIGGGIGNDRGFGGTGNDILFGENGDDTLTGNEGNDTVVGGAGNDVLFGEDGNDFLVGDEGDDTLNAGTGNDVAMGGAGSDLIGLGEGDDLATGNEGNDTLFGEGGNDTLLGGAGDDLLNGGAGNDVLFADGGADTLWGGAGADLFAFGRSSGGLVVMDFQAGVDRLALYDATIDLGAVIRSARVEGGNTTLDIGSGNRITILGQTGNVAAWFG